MSDFDWDAPQDEPVLTGMSDGLDDDDFSIPTEVSSSSAIDYDGWGSDTRTEDEEEVVVTRRRIDRHAQPAVQPSPVAVPNDSEIDLFDGDDAVPIDAVSAPAQGEPKAPINLSMKACCFILAGVLFLVMIILVVINNVKVTPKQSQPAKQNTTQVSQPQQVQNTNGVSLMSVPEGTKVDYTGAVYKATGTVSGKTMYLQGTQVIYCIDISLQVGSSSQIVKHYCNYDVYNQVSVGTLLTVQYQQVSQSCLSVNSVGW